MIVYGIKSCDSVKKATTWLSKHKIPFTFHDYKAIGITASKLKSWSQQIGWETFLNKKSTTWRGLDLKIQNTVKNEKAAVQVMMENTSLIKRPLIEKEGKVLTLGYKEEEYERIFLSGKT